MNLGGTTTYEHVIQINYDVLVYPIAVRGGNCIDYGLLPFEMAYSRGADQNNPGDGLKVLSVNVMQCTKMLVLCGATYVHRLWFH